MPKLTYLRQRVCPFEVALDEAVVVLPFLVLAFNRHLVARSLHADLIRFEMGHVQVHFELFFVVRHLSAVNSKHLNIFIENIKFCVYGCVPN